MFLCLSIFLPWFTAYFIICYLWPDLKRSGAQALMRGSLAIGMGFGISSCLFFVCLLFVGSHPDLSFVIDLSIFISSGCLFLYKVRKKDIRIGLKPEKKVSMKFHRPSLMLAGFYVICTLAITFFILNSVNESNGTWDAIAIWNMRARFLFRGGDKWTEAFSNLYAWSHPDYPLLIPGNVARIWTYVGHETTLAPIVLAFLFTFATVALMVSAIAYLRSSSQGLIAGMVLMGTSFFISHGNGQSADVPLGYFILAAVILFCLHDAAAGRGLQLLVFFSGMMAGFAAWTKNEGLLFIVSLIAARFLVTIPRKGWRSYREEMLFFIAGLLPILIIVAYFKTQIAPPNDLLSGQGFNSMMHKITDATRYAVIGKAFISKLLTLMKAMIFIFPLCLVLFGCSHEKKNHSGMVMPLFVLCFMLSGYFMIFLITPNDLIWHLNTALQRLFLQLLPVSLFAFFLGIATPEEVTWRCGI